MIRNVVIHVSNEQPLLADLFGLPQSTDVGLICTNLRMPDGKRPVFIDSSDATFFFPYRNVRFIEIPHGALADLRALGSGDTGSARLGGSAGEREGGANGTHALRSAILAQSGSAAADAEQVAADAAADDADIELDEDFIRRLREV